MIQLDKELLTYRQECMEAIRTMQVHDPYRYGIEGKDPIMFFHDVPVYYVPECIHEADGCIAAAVRTTPNDNGYIMVDDDFMELSPRAKRACLYHELGHIVHMHAWKWLCKLPDILLKSNGDAIRAAREDNLQCELEADAYAMDNESPWALLEVLLYKSDEWESYPELEERIRIIKAHIARG